MSGTRGLRNAGQSIWLDNISRGMLDRGEIQRYIDEFDVTGLTSNPTIFDRAISSGDYDDSIAGASANSSSEEIFFDLAIDDLRRAADLFAPVHELTNGLDGWVSLEVSPLLAYDAVATTASARWVHDAVQRPNLFVKIPGTPEGIEAIEACIAEGIAINVTLLFDENHYVAAAEAYLRGLERRVAQGLNPDVGCVASVFISRWDGAVNATVSDELRNGLGLAVGAATYRAYQEILASPRMRRLMNFGARPQRLLWASTGTKDPAASDTLYVSGLATPFTINTMPDATLLAYADHGELGSIAVGADVDHALARFDDAGVDRRALAEQLQRDGAASFVSSWNDLIAAIDHRRAAGAPQS